MLLTLKTKSDILIRLLGDNDSGNIGNTLDINTDQIQYIQRVNDNQEKLNYICLVMGQRTVIITDEDQNTCYDLYFNLKKAIRKKYDYLQVEDNGTISYGNYNTK